jgi:predicted nucleic acid-binding protein
VIVVDTNILAYLLLPYELSAQADVLFKRDPEWVVPILWRSEFRNLLAGYVRRKTLTFDEALELPRFRGHFPLKGRVPNAQSQATLCASLS